VIFLDTSFLFRSSPGTIPTTSECAM